MPSEKDHDVTTSDDALIKRVVTEVIPQRKRIVLDQFTAVKNNGILNGQEYELTDRHMEIIAECVLQTLYNLGIASNADIDYNMSIEGGTSYYTVAKDGDVMVYPREGETYRRRIRNDRSILKKHDDEISF